jgi:hypothetical protein
MVKTSIGFSPFQLAHGVELILPIECEIPSLNLAIELLPDTSNLEECLVYLERRDVVIFRVVIRFFSIY